MFYWILVTFIIFPLIYFILDELIKIYSSGNDKSLSGIIASIRALPDRNKGLHRKGDDSDGSGT
jgi:hypothetical protein